MAESLTFLTERLRQREQAGLLRQLRQGSELVDFCSNDYLGLARSQALWQRIRNAERDSAETHNGATGSRLLAGNSALVEALESRLARFYGTESALVFNSGYDANIGLFSALPQRGDVLITDELIHASMIDGARLSYAERYRFPHNDLDALDQLLRGAASRSAANVFVAVESIYSMDGDKAPLPEMVRLCAQHGAHLLVDEAHATGLYGPAGEGLVVALGLEKKVLARVHTFGKGLGVHGAAIVGPAPLRTYLLNMARSFIYTTALPPSALRAIGCAHEQVALAGEERALLHQQVAFFKRLARQQLPRARWTASTSPIQGLLVSGNAACRQVAAGAQAAGFDVRPILSPTVPPGQERIRICLHSFNTEAEITALIDSLRTQLDERIYS